MSAGNSFAEIQAAAVQAQADPEAAVLFEQQFGVTPQAFSALPEDEQGELLMQLEQKQMEEMLAAEPRVVWAEDAWHLSLDGVTETKSCVTKFNGRFQQASMTSVGGGEPRLDTFGYERETLQEAIQDATGARPKESMKSAEKQLYTCTWPLVFKGAEISTMTRIVVDGAQPALLAAQKWMHGRFVAFSNPDEFAQLEFNVVSLHKAQNDPIPWGLTRIEQEPEWALTSPNPGLNPNFSVFVASLRNPETGSQYDESIAVWSWQDVKEVAEKTAASYSANVVEIRHQDGSPYVQPNVDDGPSPGM